MKRVGLALLLTLALVLAIFAAAILGRAPATPSPERGAILVGPSPAADAPLRFVLVGDQGKGNDKQFAVAAAMKRACEERGGCAFAVALGDNFYPTGVASADDPQWESKFEKPYEALPFPFWGVLGNHDYGGNGGGWEFWRAEAQLEYAKKNPKWKMPGRYYAFNAGPVDFFVIDTTELFYGRGSEQRDSLRKQLGASRAPWRFVAGHHPYLSNGHHGNAGAFDHVPLGLPASGAPVKAFIEEEICGKAQVYAAGHDHNMQDLVSPSPCPTELVISGAGASTTRLVGDNPHHFQSDESGFVLVSATATEMTFSFFNADAIEMHARTITKN